MLFRTVLVCFALIGSFAVAKESSFSQDKKPSSRHHHRSSRKPHREDNQKPSIIQSTTVVISQKQAFGKVSLDIPSGEKIEFPKDLSCYPWAPFSAFGTFDPLSKNVDFDQESGSITIKEPGVYSIEYFIKAAANESFFTYLQGPLKVALRIQGEDKDISKPDTIEILRLFNSIESASLVASSSKQVLLSLATGDKVSLIVQGIPAYNGRTKEEKEIDERLEIKGKDTPMSLYFMNDDEMENSMSLLVRKID
jgi:hypothetical protein